MLRTARNSNGGGTSERGCRATRVGGLSGRRKRSTSLRRASRRPWRPLTDRRRVRMFIIGAGPVNLILTNIFGPAERRPSPRHANHRRGTTSKCRTRTGKRSPSRNPRLSLTRGRSGSPLGGPSLRAARKPSCARHPKRGKSTFAASAACFGAADFSHCPALCPHNQPCLHAPSLVLSRSYQPWRKWISFSHSPSRSDESRAPGRNESVQG